MRKFDKVELQIANAEIDVIEARLGEPVDRKLIIETMEKMDNLEAEKAYKHLIDTDVIYPGPLHEANQ
jgi:CxxC motif-containing protein